MGTGAMGRAMLPGINEGAAVVPTTAAAAAGVVGSWTWVVSIGTGADTSRGAAVAATAAELGRATLPVTESAITCLIGSPRKEKPAHFEHISTWCN